MSREVEPTKRIKWVPEIENGENNCKNNRRTFPRIDVRCKTLDGKGPLNTTGWIFFKVHTKKKKKKFHTYTHCEISEHHG